MAIARNFLRTISHKSITDRHVKNVWKTSVCSRLDNYPVSTYVWTHQADRPRLIYLRSWRRQWVSWTDIEFSIQYYWSSISSCPLWNFQCPRDCALCWVILLWQSPTHLSFMPYELGVSTQVRLIHFARSNFPMRNDQDIIGNTLSHPITRGNVHCLPPTTDVSLRSTLYLMASVLTIKRGAIGRLDKTNFRLAKDWYGLSSPRGIEQNSDQCRPPSGHSALIDILSSLRCRWKKDLAQTIALFLHMSGI